MQVGDVISWERSFTREDVDLFTRVSGDTGVHHVQPDAQGRLMVQGLLTATLPTKIGGDLNYVARQMLFDFKRPVYTEDLIRCEVTLTRLETSNGRTLLEATFVCRNQDDREVLSGTTHGIILQRS